MKVAAHGHADGVSTFAQQVQETLPCSSRPVFTLPLPADEGTAPFSTGRYCRLQVMTSVQKHVGRYRTY